MISVAYYVEDNSTIPCIDGPLLEDSNPGMGGTEYLFYLIVYELQKHSDKIRVELLSTRDTRQIVGFQNTTTVYGLIPALNYCIQNGIDIFVIRDVDKDDISRIKSFEDKIKIIVWAHNILGRERLTTFAKNKIISKIVNVGREQMDLYRDHKAFLKSTYIYNCIPKFDNISLPFQERKKEVTYLGALIPTKGFHILAKAWKNIVSCHPDAHLNVIGTGTVYGGQKLGRYGIAEANYENYFMHYISDRNGDILPSVTFYGNLGVKKYEILKKTKVGVPNPTGYSESFCLSAVEMGLHGCWLVTKKYCGFLDTIPEFAGSLYTDETDLAKSVIKGLNKTDYDNTAYKKYVFKEFSIEVVINCWLNLFNHINDKERISPFLYHKDYNFKLLREYNRKIKTMLPMGYYLPTIDFYIKLLNKVLNRKIPIVW